ncbi:transposase [Curvibacter sp. APW13]|uniref:transposase n=1 Tax=Curvibacter sp. APW13 TaxID=3077236 RepID=UPI0028DD9CC5|nr:transposase [Curvibacter sp. APW13]MDT8989581.1 transposase [Curvibacter sp. APW13]
MARLARLAIAGQAHHVIQRGLGGVNLFPEVADRLFFLECLASACRGHRVQLHAYVLLDDHFQLLVTIAEAESLAKAMQAVGRAYVRYFNDRYRRRGTLWEGRYRSTVIQAARYMLPCMVSFDWNPVLRSQAARPSDYAWSSHGHYAGHRVDSFLVSPAQYWSLGNTPFAREAKYAVLVEQGLTAQEHEEIASSALRGWALGDPDFVAKLQMATTRRMTKGRPGRPAAAVKNSSNL